MSAAPCPNPGGPSRARPRGACPRRGRQSARASTPEPSAMEGGARAAPSPRERQGGTIHERQRSVESVGVPAAQPGLYRGPHRSAADPAPEEPAPFPLRTRTEADRGWRWGLLAWEDPDGEAGPASPFWADAPMLEAAPSPEAPALAELLKEPEVRLSGLRLDDGPRSSRSSDGGGSVQIRIAGGAGFDPAGRDRASIADGAGPAGAAAPEAAELWPVGGAETKKEGAARASLTKSC